MKRPNTSSLMAVLVVLIVSIGVGSFSSAQDVPCAVPAPLARTNGATWPKGTNVKVIINPTAFPTNEQRDAIKAAFDTWQNANTNSGVTFTVTTGTQPAQGQEINTYYITRGTTTTGGDTNIGYTGSPSTAGNKTQSAVTIVDSTMTRLSTITNMMVHEIGHTFGLDDCMSCTQGSSMMSAYKNDCFCTSYQCDQSAPFNGMRWGCPPLTAPRDCEVLAVAQRSDYPPPPSPTPILGGGGGSGGGVCQYDDTGCEDCVPDDGLAWQNCRNLEAYWAIFPTCGCSDPSPILVDLSGNGFNLTNRANGVMFDLNNDGIKNHIQWTSALTDDAWLCLDRDGNSTIDNGGELFGNFTPQPEPPLGQERNGFLALAEYDKLSNGGNGDGLITEADTIFGSLRLWQDVNHDGISDADELFQLRLANVATLELGYKTSKYIDAYGNEFRYRAKIKDAKGAQVGRWMWDVYLVRVP